MKHKVSELDGALLDAAVAMAEGVSILQLAGTRYSTDWADGGPIIGRELIAVSAHVYDNGPAQCCCWVAAVAIYGMFDVHYSHPPKRWYGPTPLIAAMRAYVASKFGEEIDL